MVEPIRLARAGAGAGFVLGLTLLCAACTTVGPNFKRPEEKAPPDWAAAAAPGLGDVDSKPVPRPFDGRRWWSVFRDPVLDGLVAEAVRQNLDVQTAAARIAEARAQRQSAAGAELPSVAANGIAGRSRQSESGIGSALSGGSSSGSGSGSAGAGGGASGGSSSQPSSTTNLFQFGFDATWELDLWGGTRRNVEAADASIESAEQARGDAAVSVTAEIVRAYLTLRGGQRQRAIAVANLADQQRLLALVKSRAGSGFVAQSDVPAQAAQVAAAEAQIPPIEQNIEQSRNRVEQLLAQPPGGYRERLSSPPQAGVPLPPEVPIGLPGDLLRRRPDVLRREAELHAATARVGVAEAKLFPSITLGLFGGQQATRFSDLTDWASRFFAGGALLQVPIFQGGQLRGQVKVADAQLAQAALAYRQTVLSAYHDADNALIAYAQEQRHASALTRQFEQARLGRESALVRYRGGLASFIDVLDADRTARQAELSALQSNITASTNLVALYKALGGDWSERRGDESP